jgi:UDP-arabinose 4-epimerase
MARVLVTGGAGYIGSHACKALARAGHEPVVYDSLEHGFRDFVRWGPLERGDMLDSERLTAVIRAHKPEAVLHFAAYIAAGESVENPGKYYRNNVGGSLSLLQAMRDEGVGHLVFSSTAAVYGNPLSTPIAEDHRLLPINPYAHSKLFVEQLLHDFGTAHGLKSVALRYFNAAGADPDGELGECHEPETHLIPLALKAAFGAGKPLTVFGSDYDTPDGTPIRDYIHVADLAEAHVAALRHLLAGGASATANLGVGSGYSVRDVLTATERVIGRPVPVVEGPRRAGDPTVLVADPGHAMRLLSWKPNLAALDAIIETAARWERSERRRALGHG